MDRRRDRIFVVAMVSVVGWAFACGDGGTDPQPPESPEPASVTVSPSTAEFTAVGATVQLTAEVRDQSGQAIAGAAVAWMSGDASVATVNAGGLVTAAGNGTATITATAGSASGTAAVTVVQMVIAVAVSPEADTLAVGDTVRLSATAIDTNGNAIPDAEFAWSSSDTLVAEVDDSGLVRGVGEGMATVSVASAGVEASAAITVADLTRLSLAAFYEATNGSAWIEDEGWLSDRPVGEWHGVTTGENGRVTALALPASNLVGSLPPELGNLTGLEVLDLERNALSGAIPRELGNLHRLRILEPRRQRARGSDPAGSGWTGQPRDSATAQKPPHRGDPSRAEQPAPADHARSRTKPADRGDSTGLPGPQAADQASLRGEPGTLRLRIRGLRKAWLASLEIYVGPLCNQLDRAGLVSLYEAAGGVKLDPVRPVARRRRFGRLVRRRG